MSQMTLTAVLLEGGLKRVNGHGVLFWESRLEKAFGRARIRDGEKGSALGGSFKRREAEVGKCFEGKRGVV